jgi:hypothetical protein
MAEENSSEKTLCIFDFNADPSDDVNMEDFLDYLDLVNGQPHRWDPIEVTTHLIPEDFLRLNAAYLEIKRLDQHIQDAVRRVFKKHGFDFTGGISVYPILKEPK